MTHYAMVIDLNTCTGCNACMAACAVENQTPVWADKWRTRVHDQEKGNDLANVARTFFPRLCNHCDIPACMTVCPTGATYKMDNGIVRIDDALCMGCQACVLACPYDVRYAVEYEDIHTAKEFYSEDVMKRSRPGVDKCDFCHDRVALGKQPACAATCTADARIFGDLDDPNDRVTRIVRSGKATPLLAHLGTRPNVYYINEHRQEEQP